MLLSSDVDGHQAFDVFFWNISEEIMEYFLLTVHIDFFFW